MFVCTICEKEYSERKMRYFCECGGVLLVEMKTPKWKPQGAGVWRYQLMLPVKKSVSMGEGATSSVQSTRHGYKNLYMKLEGDNPTDSFKDRGTTVAVSDAKRRGFKTVAVASTGNMGASVAAYAAHGGLKSRVFVPQGTPDEKVAQILAHGAELIKVRGTFHKCVDKAVEDLKHGSYLAETGLNPYYLEGEKTIAYEIYENLGVPDKIVAPMGTGGLVTSIFKGFKELKSMRKIKELPKMIGVQATNCSPIVDAWEAGTEEIEKVLEAKTIASAILVKTPFNGHTAIRAINESGGDCVTVAESQIIKAIKELGREGIFAEPASATTLAALWKLEPTRDETIVLIITGHGLKDPNAFLKK